MNNYIRIHQVSYSINGQAVLNNIDLSLARNQFVALVGPNGSGKTTLSKLIMGIIAPSRGYILVDNTDVKDLGLANIGSKIGYLFQNPNRQIFAATVMEELTFAYRFKKHQQPQLQQQVDEMLAVFELEHLSQAKTYFLSHGEKQRVALAAILLNDPEYLILDEPTTGLDQKRKKELSRLLQKIRSKNIGMLMISHDHQFVLEQADRIIELDRGGVVNEQHS